MVPHRFTRWDGRHRTATVYFLIAAAHRPRHVHRDGHGGVRRTRPPRAAATGATVRQHQDDTHDELTPQEAHIARLARDGRTNPEIGAQLYISARTVEWHLRKVFTKLGISSRKALHDALPTRAPDAKPA